MTDEEHNNKAQELLLESNSKDSSPTNWKFEWDSDGSPPRIIDTEGKVVAILSTGTLKGAYDTDVIIANAKRLLSGNADSTKYQIQTRPTEDQSHIQLGTVDFIFYPEIPPIDKEVRQPHHIYITSDGKIEAGDCVISTKKDFNMQTVSDFNVKLYNKSKHYFKIVATTDSKLKIECDGCKRSKGLDTIYTCSCEKFPSILEEDQAKAVVHLNNKKENIRIEHYRSVTGQCNCMCHKEGAQVMHIKACCYPSVEMVVKIKGN